MMSPADHIARLEYVVREQMTVIDQLRAENRRLLGWIMGDEPDALTTLQRIYSDPNTPRGEQIKSSSLALPYERSKPAQVSVVIDFKERVRTARLRQLELDKAEWARQDAAKAKEPLDLDGPIPETILGGPEADPAA